MMPKIQKGSRLKLACMTLDLEPDCGGRVNSFENCSRTESFEEVISCFGVKLTTFVVGKMLDMGLDVIQRLSALDSEFELHSYSHDTSGNNIPEEIRKSKAAYNRYFGRDPLGYRGPQGRITEEGLDLLAEEGFKFDASVFPSFRPGVFSNLSSPTFPFQYAERNLIEIPFAVVQKVRIPIALGYMRLMGERFYELLFRKFGMPDILVFDFHLHDLIATDAIRKLPYQWQFYYSCRLGCAQEIFKRFLKRLVAEGYTFAYMREVYEIVNSGKMKISESPV